MFESDYRPVHAKFPTKLRGNYAEERARRRSEKTQRKRSRYNTPPMRVNRRKQEHAVRKNLVWETLFRVGKTFGSRFFADCFSCHDQRENGTRGVHPKWITAAAALNRPISPAVYLSNSRHGVRTSFPGARRTAVRWWGGEIDETERGDFFNPCVCAWNSLSHTQTHVHTGWIVS